MHNSSTVRRDFEEVVRTVSYCNTFRYFYTYNERVLISLLMSIHFPKGYLMTDPNQYNPQNPQQPPQYGGYGSYGQNDYGQQAPQYDAPDYGQQAPQYGSPQYSAPQYNNAAGYNQQQPQYGAPQPQGTNGFFALTAPLDQPAYNCTIGEAFTRFWKKYATFKGSRLPRRILVVDSVQLHHHRGSGRHHRWRRCQWHSKNCQRHLGTGNDSSLPRTFRSPPARHQ